MNREQQSGLTNPSTIEARALEALVADLGPDFGDFVTARELADMLDERAERMRRRQAMGMAA